MRRLWSECCGFYSSASPSAASSPCWQAIDTLPKAPPVHPSMCNCSNPTIAAWLSPPQSRSSSPLCSSSSSYYGIASNGTSDHLSSTTGIEMCCCCISLCSMDRHTQCYYPIQLSVCILPISRWSIECSFHEGNHNYGISDMVEQ